jgi:hypothetical protein
MPPASASALWSGRSTRSADPRPILCAWRRSGNTSPNLRGPGDDPQPTLSGAQGNTRFTRILSWGHDRGFVLANPCALRGGWLSCRVRARTQTRIASPPPVVTQPRVMLETAGGWRKLSCPEITDGEQFSSIFASNDLVAKTCSCEASSQNAQSFQLGRGVALSYVKYL